MRTDTASKIIVLKLEFIVFYSKIEFYTQIYNSTHFYINVSNTNHFILNSLLTEISFTE